MTDPSIPDYPPPSFQEAISTSPYSPTFPLPTADTSPGASHLSRTPTLPPSSLPASVPETLHVDTAQDLPSPVLSNFSISEEDNRLSPDPNSDSDTDSIEVLTLDSPQRWEAERQLGLPLAERVAREFERQLTAESTATLALPQMMRPQTSSPTPPSSPSSHMRRCSHCGSARPSNCDEETHDGHDEEEESEEVIEPVKLPKFQRFLGKKNIKINSDCPSSVPSSPISPTSMARMPSAWASNLTLSIGGAFTGHRTSPLSSSPKKRENTVIRKLFRPKGKDRPPTPPDLIGEPFESWEVVDSATQDTRQSMVQMANIESSLRRAALRVDPVAANLSRSVPSPLQSSPFLERPVRPMQVPLSTSLISSPIQPPSSVTPYRYRLPSEISPMRSPASQTLLCDRRIVQPTYVHPPREKIRRF